MNSETKRYSRRITLSAVAYLIFLYYVCHSPEESVFTNITSIVFALGFLALIAFLAFLVLSLLILLVSNLFYFWGGKELKDWVWDSFNGSAGFIAGIVVLILLFFPLMHIWENPYRFPYLHGILNWIVSVILRK